MAYNPFTQEANSSYLASQRGLVNRDTNAINRVNQERDNIVSVMNRNRQRNSPFYNGPQYGYEMTGEHNSAINATEAKRNQRQGLISAIEGMGDSYQSDLDLLNQEAGSALQSGLSNTRKNYNQRGLLYSGLRQGGEQSVKGQVANQLASGTANTTRDYQNTLDARKQALANIDLAGRQESLNNANMAFEQTTRNNIARMQAMQQLGEGVGSVAGMYYGRESSAPGGQTQMTDGRVFGQRGA